MYPNLYYAFKDLFGVNWTFLHFINSFGFFVAVAFILAAVVLTRELKRKSRQGLVTPTEMQITVGRPATPGELALNFLLGFLLGYKILALFIMQRSATEDAQAFIFSTIGSWPAGIGLGLLFAGLKWWDKNKHKLAKPETRTVRIWPHDRVGEITIIALVFGLLGAKLFDIFENWGDFIKRPGDYIFSPRGLTFYGGLICAALAIWWYAKRHRIGFWHLNDSAAPALMIAYAVGRIGCQVSGDGDWGIFNSAYKLDENNKIVLSAPGDFQRTMTQYSSFFLSEGYRAPDEVPRAGFAKPGALKFLPDWIFAYDFPHNVNEQGIKLPDCNDNKYCEHLPAPVFPTSFYETVTCLLLFLVIWYAGKKMKIPGTVFGLYLMLNGVERFFIEKIRVNNRISFLGLHPTQAELISVFMFLAGLGICIYLSRKGKPQDSIQT